MGWPGGQRHTRRRSVSAGPARDIATKAGASRSAHARADGRRLGAQYSGRGMDSTARTRNVADQPANAEAGAASNDGSHSLSSASSPKERPTNRSDCSNRGSKLVPEFG